MYEVNCNLCQNTTLHSADDDAGAQEQHKSGAGHADTKKRWDELTSSIDDRIKNAEFKHGKEHNG
jgi:hypothetical protein